MLSEANRLKKKKDLERVFRRGQGFKEGFLFLKIVSNNLKTSRFAFVISLKVAKKASLRNKIKRRLREIIKIKLPKMKTGFDIVLVTFPGIETQDFQEIEETINKLFKKAKIWHR